MAEGAQLIDPMAMVGMFMGIEHGIEPRDAGVEELGADAFLYGTAEHDDSGTQIIARIDARMPHEKGSVLHLAAKPDQVHVFSTSTEERLSH